jgi:hypothetical protein
MLSALGRCVIALLRCIWGICAMRTRGGDMCNALSLDCVQLKNKIMENNTDNGGKKVIALGIIAFAVLALVANAQEFVSGGNKFILMILGPFFMFLLYWILKNSGLFD